MEVSVKADKKENLLPPVAPKSRGSNYGIVPSGGGNVSKEFEQEINAKFEDCYATIETNKESIDHLKQEIGGVRNDMLTKLSGASMSSPTGPSKADKKAE